MAKRRTRAKRENTSPWRGAAIIAGLLVGCAGFLGIEPAIETAAIVYHRENYRAVEFEIENVVPAKHSPDLRGRILPGGTAAEAYASEFTEIWTGTARSMVRQVKPTDELHGLKLPAWHNPAIPKWLDEARVLSRSKRPLLPQFASAVGAGLFPVIALGIAAALVTWGAWLPRR